MSEKEFTPQSRTPSNSPANNSSTPPAGNPANRPDIPALGQEYDTPKWVLPPASAFGIALAAVAVVIALVFWFARAKPTATGSIDNVASVELPDKASVLVAINVTARNIGEKPFFIHDIKASIKTDKGDFSDEAASAVDFERYFQAYPALRERAIPALVPETRIPLNGEAKGTVIVSFPVNEDGFEHRKSLTVTVGAYDQRPLVITK